ncbi:MAG: hypothetical protein M3063_12445 [Actinomycetota bacterium]|nr:hypothetical protein [Actinomycetota bacterium]MDQ6945835.1 hypothetical protein [Actinomycetota bacterium]
MTRTRRPWAAAVFILLAVSYGLAACDSAASGVLTGRSKASFCSGERTINAGLEQRAKATTDDMGLGVTLNQAKTEIADAARSGPASVRPRLAHLTEGLHQAIDEIVTGGMGPALDPIVTEIQKDLNSFGRTCKS